MCVDHKGHFCHENGTETDENGRLYCELLFGENHVSVFSNNPQHGNLQHGKYIQGSDQADVATKLWLDVNDHGGSSVVLCGGWEAGMDSATFVTALYMIRTGSDTTCSPKLIAGEDKWTFDTDDSGCLQVKIIVLNHEMKLVGLSYVS